MTGLNPYSAGSETAGVVRMIYRHRIHPSLNPYSAGSETAGENCNHNGCYTS